MPTNVHVYRDQRTQQEEVVYGFQVTREVLHDQERELRMSVPRFDDNFTTMLGNRLVGMRYAPPVFQAWMDLPDSGLSGGMDGGRYDLHNPKHHAGMCMMAMLDYAPEMYQSLISLDNRCRVQFEASYNNLDMTVNLYIRITVPQTMVYGRGTVAFNEPRMRESSLSLTRRVDTMDVEMGGMVERVITSNPTVGITLGGVDLGEFRDIPINVAESALSGPERERLRQDAAEASHQAYLTLQKVEAAAERAEAAMAAPQGDLAPRKVKRVSVAIGTETLPAESPRRLKVRRDRNN